MRSLFAAVVVATTLLAGCSTPDFGAEPVRPAAATITPEMWTMSPSGLGPITVKTTRDEALATGYFRPAPAPCASERLDRKGQTYKDGTAGQAAKVQAKPLLGTISYDDDGKVSLIESGKDAVTDQGIRKSDSLSRLQYTYGDELIPGPGQAQGAGSFAVNGRNSHLVYEVAFNKVVGFYVLPGVVENPQDVMPARFMTDGVVGKPEDMTPGSGGVC